LPAEVTSGGDLAKVRWIDEELGIAYLELLNGTTARSWAQDVLACNPGDVVLLERDEAGLSVSVVPPEVWPADDLWVGVVRLRLDDITIVESNGRWRRVPNNAVACEIGNTVEARDTGIVRVLSSGPIRYVDLQDRDSVNVDDFIRTGDAALGFADFGGLEDVAARARELIEVPLRYHEALTAIGARPVKGVLFTGGPGTGKTMLARIIAGAADATFYQVSGPEIVSKWHGESENILRAVFAHAATQDRSIIFFDEIDSIAVQRSGDAHEASKRLVAQLLVLMDGFTQKENIVVIAATNRPEDIDVALRRPGRFDWTIEFRPPDEQDRLEILAATAARLRADGGLPHDAVARQTEGWSGADLNAIFSEAALLAVTDERDVLMAEDYLGGVERVAGHRAHARAVGRPEPS
jgi:transitional endoplasmic reticulum ATPase